MCCGRNRMQQGTSSSRSPIPRAAQVVGQQRMQPNVSFIYVGNTGMSVTGPVSGIQYRFDRPGSRVDVDPRDRVLLASIRQLRQVT